MGFFQWFPLGGVQRLQIRPLISSVNGGGDISSVFLSPTRMGLKRRGRSACKALFRSLQKLALWPLQLCYWCQILSPGPGPASITWNYLVLHQFKVGIDLSNPITKAGTLLGVKEQIPRRPSTCCNQTLDTWRPHGPSVGLPFKQSENTENVSVIIIYLKDLHLTFPMLRPMLKNRHKNWADSKLRGTEDVEFIKLYQ